jgi:hypothetical protein
VGEFLLWTLAFLGLLATTLGAVGTALFPLLLLLTVSLGLAGPLSSWLADRLGAQRMRVEDLEQYLRGTQERPDLPYNYTKLGDLFYAGGEWGRAAEWYEQSLQVHTDPDVRYRLGKARERETLGPGQPVLCLCGKLNSRGARQCKYCGRHLRGSHDLLVELGAGHGRLVLLLIAAGLLSGGIALSLLRLGDPFLNGVLLLLGVGAAVLHFGATQAVGIQVGGTETSDHRPQTSNPEGKPEGKPPKG